MSLFRIANTAKYGSAQFATRAVLTSLPSTQVFKRSYWWRRKSDEKDESKEKDKIKEENELKKTDGLPENLKQKEINGLPGMPANPMGENKLKNDLAQYSDSLLRSDIGGPVNEGFVELPPNPRMGGNPFKAFQDFMTPRPLRLHDEMVIPAIPLPLRPLLPGFMQNLTISDRATIQKLREVQRSADRYVGLFLRKEKSSNDLADSPDVIRNLSEVYSVGTYVYFLPFICRCAELQDIRMIGTNASIVLLGRSRISIRECIQLGPPTLVKVDRIPPPVNDLDEVTINAYSNEIFSYTQLIAASNSILGEYLTLFMQRRETDNPLYFADFAGGLTLENRELQQQLLESRSYPERFEIAIKLFNHELQAIRMQQDLKKKVEENTKETERKYMLKEQMKVIQQQLGGDKDPKQSYIEKIQEKVADMEKRKVSPAAIGVGDWE